MSKQRQPMPSPPWPYTSPGIPDELFERLPGIPMTQRDTRLLLISQLRLTTDTVLWDIGAGTGTIPIEAGLLCPQGQIIAIERDEEVVNLIQANCDRFAVENVDIIQGNAPGCLDDLQPQPTRICIEGGHPMQELLRTAWSHLQTNGRLVASASSLETLYIISETFSSLHARNIEVVQSVINRLETRGTRQLFAAVDPMFILSGEKL